MNNLLHLTDDGDCRHVTKSFCLIHLMLMSNPRLLTSHCHPGFFAGTLQLVESKKVDMFSGCMCKKHVTNVQHSFHIFKEVDVKFNEQFL